MKITIAHIYPDLLNLYGDNGNIAALSYRLQKRGIKPDIVQYQPDDKIDLADADILFIGGGSDKEILTVGDCLRPYAPSIKAFAEDGGCILAICGGYHLLGSYYMHSGDKIAGLGLLDIHADEADKRFIGNIILQSGLIGTTVAGFENHAGIVNIGTHTPFAKVISGYDNDGTHEGVVYKNVIGTHLHGPLLPKNPALADFILAKALERKYGKADLAPLDDTLENLAHDYAVKNFS